jgi:hypothetical protein
MWTNRFAMKLGLLVIFVGTAVGTVTVYRFVKPTKPFLVTSSPKGTYAVAFTGDRERPKYPFITHHVMYSVTKNQKDYLDPTSIHSGDWMDASFELQYPDYQWVSEDILQLFRGEFFSKEPRESIRVINKATEKVQYLRIDSIDAFLLFDIQPTSEITLTVSARRGDSRWIEVECGLSEGRNIKQDDVTFIVDSNKKGPFTYDITIDDSGITINSSELRRYEPK